MERLEFEEIQQTLLTIGGMAAGLDLEGFLQVHKTTETMGRITDPAGLREALPRMQAVKRLAEALKPFQGAYECTVQTFLNEAVMEAGGPTDKRLM